MQCISFNFIQMSKSGSQTPTFNDKEKITLSLCTRQVLKHLRGKRCAGKATRRILLYYCQDGDDQLVLGLVDFIGRGPTYLIWTAIVFFDRLGSNCKLQANDPIHERICSRRLCTRICPAWFAERYELRANDPGHGAWVPEKSSAACLFCTD